MVKLWVALGRNEDERSNVLAVCARREEAIAVIETHQKWYDWYSLVQCELDVHMDHPYEEEEMEDARRRRKV